MDEHLSFLSKTYPKIKDAPNWQEVHRFSTQDDINFVGKSVLNDTTWYVSFYYFNNENYFLKKITKEFEDSVFKHELMFKEDTFYYYIEPKDGGDKTFLSENYGYQCEYGQLSIPQRDYFILHQDSLVKIRGNNLPDLPELEEK